MRALLSSFVVLTLTASAALAGQVGPLAPGLPAGVKKAQDVSGHTLLYIALGAGAIAGIAVAASSGGGSAPVQAPASSTTTSTGTSA